MISNFQDQLSGFLLSVFFGIFLSMVYDILKIIRKFTSPKQNVVFTLDFSFLSFCAIATFIAAFSTNYGVLRVYHIIGEAIGALIYFITLGKITYFAAEKIILVLSKIEVFLKNNYQKIQIFLINKIKSKKMSKKGSKKLEKSKKAGV